MKDLPITMQEPDGWLEKTGGYAKDMTLRDYFAAKAMDRVMAIWYNDLSSDLQPFDALDDNKPSSTAWLIARDCYGFADAMLEAIQR